MNNIGCDGVVSDPIANPDAVKKEYGITLTDWRTWSGVNMLILAVSHNEYKGETINKIVKSMVKYNDEAPVLADIKGIVSPDVVLKLKETNICYWRY